MGSTRASPTRRPTGRRARPRRWMCPVRPAQTGPGSGRRWPGTSPAGPPAAGAPCCGSGSAASPCSRLQPGRPPSSTLPGSPRPRTASPPPRGSAGCCARTGDPRRQTQRERAFGASGILLTGQPVQKVCRSTGPARNRKLAARPESTCESRTQDTPTLGRDGVSGERRVRNRVPCRELGIGGEGRPNGTPHTRRFLRAWATAVWPPCKKDDRPPGLVSRGPACFAGLAKT